MNNDKGFTLVEVIAAMAVVAIVSTSLFQMFVTSTYVNRDAQVMDIANIIVVQQAETFKADPANYSLDHSIHDYSYYNGEGAFLISALVADSIPSGAVIQVESQLDSYDISATSSNVAYHPYPDLGGGTFPLITDYAVTILENTDPDDPDHILSYEVNVDGSDGTSSTNTIDSLSIKNNILPFGLDSDLDTTQREINLSNDSDLEANFYILNVMANDQDLSFTPFVTLNSIRGSSSLFYVPVAGSKNMKYVLTLTVSKLNKLSDGTIESKELFKYSDSDDPDDLQNPKKSSIYKHILTN